jgi:hypothetical protein
MTGLTINAHPMASVLVARTDLTDDQAYALAEMSERVRAQISTVYPLAGLRTCRHRRRIACCLFIPARSVTSTETNPACCSVMQKCWNW